MQYVTYSRMWLNRTETLMYRIDHTAAKTVCDDDTAFKVMALSVLLFMKCAVSSARLAAMHELPGCGRPISLVGLKGKTVDERC